MKKFILLQLILVVLVHFTSEAKRLVESHAKCPGFELQIQDNNEEDSAIIIERQDFTPYFFVANYFAPVINNSNYKIQILKPPQNI